MGKIVIENRSTLNIGRQATQEDVTTIRQSILRREVSLTKVIGFELSVHGQRSNDYMLERAQTSLEAMHEISLKLGKITLMKMLTNTASGQVQKGVVTSKTLMDRLRSNNEAVSILEDNFYLFTLRNNATLRIITQRKAGEHSIAMSARNTQKSSNAYVCQPDFTLAEHILIRPILTEEGKIGCTISSAIDVQKLEAILNEHFENVI